MRRLLVPLVALASIAAGVTMAQASMESPRSTADQPSKSNPVGASGPWACRIGSYFEVAGGQLKTSTNLTHWTKVGPAGAAVGALAYSPDTHYLYAMLPSRGAHGSTVVEIAKNGVQTTLGQVAGLPRNVTWRAGDIDPASGLYYVASGPSTLYVVDLTTLTASPVAIPSGSPFAYQPSGFSLGGDFVIDEGWLWTVSGKDLQGLDLAAAITKRFVIPKAKKTNIVDSMWTDAANGGLDFRFSSSGQIKSATGLSGSTVAITPVGVSPAGKGTANGATCVGTEAPSADNAARLLVSGNATKPFAPGVSQRINVKLVNTYSSPVHVSGGTLKVYAVDSSAACPATTNFKVRQGVPVNFTVPANTSTSLSGLGLPTYDWPNVVMLDTTTNQDACEGTTVTLEFYFRYHG